jgi:putative transposase
MEYRQGSHTKFKIESHVVWVTSTVITYSRGDLALRMRELVRQTCEGFDVKILRGIVSKDHVHISFSAPANISPANIIREGVKDRVSRKIFEEFPHVKKRYWGKHFWARGYFFITSGGLIKDMIQKYLEHHFKKDPYDRFNIECINRQWPVLLDFESANINPPV